jgi:hypothetical protein
LDPLLLGLLSGAIFEGRSGALRRDREKLVFDIVGEGRSRVKEQDAEQ